MNYLIALSGSDLIKIGKALDLLPHGEVKELVTRVQAQISAQEAQQQAAQEAAKKE